VASLAIIKNAIYKAFQGMTGKSLNVDLETKYSDDAELYGQSGVYHKPVDGTMGVKIDVNGNNIVIATHNYSLDKDVEAGETLLYCIDDTGAVLSSCLLNESGEFVVNDGTRDAARKDDAVRVTIPAGTFIVSVSGGSGSPAVGVLNPNPIDVDGTIIEGTNKVKFP